ncbi:hypothetical protein BCR36DRAFT_368068 [Piromyces finnis]|uniref:Uncharacterized protein n=1 Tax=Piromyces finnis TaxID=1754191 RepID=A0A1Y1VHS7_9FUNG|nr:hypothetical protein BCR36DRAFT_368068 [Piromyces finnis]|eukprot:ORX55321.1 hypothetical protein BCR36DRAFT_368068 [Piromyces finnis]
MNHPSDMSKTKQFKLLDGDNPLKFSYHTKEIKITSNSDPLCEKLRSRFFPSVNPLLDKSKKKWSTFGPICLNTDHKKKKNTQKKNIKSSSSLSANPSSKISSRKVKIKYYNDIEVTNPPSPPPNSKNNKNKISNNNRKTLKKPTTKQNNKKFKIACIDDDVINIDIIKKEDNINNENLLKNNVHIIDTSTNHEIITEPELEGDHNNSYSQDYYSSEKFNIDDQESNITENELYSEKIKNESFVESEFIKEGKTDKESDESENLEAIHYKYPDNEDGNPIKKLLNADIHSESSESNNSLLPNENQNFIEPITYDNVDDDDNKKDDSNNNNNNNVLNKETSLLKSLIKSEENISLNNSISIHSFQHKSINSTKAVNSPILSLNSSENIESKNDISILNNINDYDHKEMMIENINNENSYDDNTQNINIPININKNNSDKDENDEIILASSSSSSLNEDTNKSERSRNSSNSSSTFNESFLINRSNILIEKSILLKEKINKSIIDDKDKTNNTITTTTNNNNNNNNNLKKTVKGKNKLKSSKSSCSLKSSSKSNTSPSIIISNDDQIESEDNEEINNIWENTSKISKNTNSISNISKMSIGLETTTHKSSKKQLHDNTNARKMKSKEKINEKKINKELKDECSDTSEIIIGKEQDCPFIKIPGDIIIHDTPIFDNNEDSYKIKNETKEKRKLIYNTLSSLSEISDTIDAVENNIKIFNEEIIEAPSPPKNFTLFKSKSDGVLNNPNRISSLIIKSDEDIQYTILSITSSLRNIQNQTIQEMLESSHFLQPIITSLQSIVTYAKYLLKILNIFIVIRNSRKEKQKLRKTKSDLNITKKSVYHHQTKHIIKNPDTKNDKKLKHQYTDKYKFYKSQINVLLEVMESMINSYYNYMENIEKNVEII